jgi:uncharacterized membrane protein required for colicin V production
MDFSMALQLAPLTARLLSNPIAIQLCERILGALDDTALMIIATIMKQLGTNEYLVDTINSFEVAFLSTLKLANPDLMTRIQKFMSPTIKEKIKVQESKPKNKKNKNWFQTLLDMFKNAFKNVKTFFVTLF